MFRYAALLGKGHNTVYYEASKRLALAELELAAAKLPACCGNCSVKEIAGQHYAAFGASERLREEDISLLSRLSFACALFEERDIGGETALFPVQMPESSFISGGLGAMMKYTGKTNADFTRLLINAAVFSADIPPGERVRLFDPVAGKGTTMLEGLTCGYDSYGVEISPDPVRDSVNFLKRYLEKGKYKHTFKRVRQSGPDKIFTAEVNSFAVGRDKEDIKTGTALVYSFVAGDSRYAAEYFKKDFFHVIAGDLPYGVQHGSVSNQKQSALTRNPRELLEACLPGWLKCLKPGGAIALSWNKFVYSREDMEKTLARCGAEVYNVYPYDCFEHRVDQAINRDIVVAKKLREVSLNK